MTTIAAVSAVAGARASAPAALPRRPVQYVALTHRALDALLDLAACRADVIQAHGDASPRERVAVAEAVRSLQAARGRAE